MAAFEHHIVNYEWAHIKHTKARSVGTWEFLSLLFFLIRLHSQRVGWVFGIPASVAALERLIVGPWVHVYHGEKAKERGKINHVWRDSQCVDRGFALARLSRCCVGESPTGIWWDISQPMKALCMQYFHSFSLSLSLSNDISHGDWNVGVIKVCQCTNQLCFDMCVKNPSEVQTHSCNGAVEMSTHMDCLSLSDHISGAASSR